MDKIRTIDDETCEDIMTYQILYKYSINEEAPLPFSALTDNDKELLIEFASKLFNTLENPKDIYDKMYKFVYEVATYRSKVSMKQTLLSLPDTSPPKKSHKTIDQRAISLKKHIETIIQLIGDDITPRLDDDINDLLGIKDNRNKKNIYYLKFVLEDVYNNPTNYLLEHPTKIVVSKQPILNYLISLKLSQKTNEINEFIKRLSN